MLEVHQEVRRLRHVHRHDVVAVTAQALDDCPPEPAVGARYEGPLHGLTAPYRSQCRCRDRVLVLVPVPGARIRVEVLRRIGGIERIAAPLDRHLLVHERAVGAVEGEVLAPVGPVVRLVRCAVALRLVQALAHEPLPRPARVHGEGDLLVVLGDREGAGVLADAAAGVRAPGRGEQVDELLAVEVLDRVVVAAPALVDLHLPRALDALVAELGLDVGDEAEHRLGHQVVQHQPLALHRRAELLRRFEVARLDRLDRPVHRRSRELLQLLRLEPAFAHRCTPWNRSRAAARRVGTCSRGTPSSGGS